MRKSMYDVLQDNVALANAVKTADGNGSTIDMKGFHSCLFTAIIGAAGDTLSTTVRIELEMEESDDGSTWTDCADADVEGYVDGTNDGCWAYLDASGEAATVYQAAYKGAKRYVRCVLNLAGTHSTGTPIGVIAHLGHAVGNPVS